LPVEKSSLPQGHRSRWLLWGFLIVGLVAVLWAAYAFRTRTVTYEMTWITGKDAEFTKLAPSVDREGNYKVMLLFPENHDCYLFAYSNEFLDYLKSRNDKTIPVTLRLTYSYGQPFYFEVKRLGDYAKPVHNLFMGRTGNPRCW